MSDVPEKKLAPRPARHFPAREKQKQETRQRLIDAALACFKESGFRAVSVDEIATRAGTHRKTFYLHFKSKADLVRGAIGFLGPVGRQAFAQLDAAEDPGTEPIQAWIRDMRALHEQHESVIDIIGSALSSEPEMAGEFVKLAGYFTQGMRSYLGRFSGVRRRGARQRLLMMYMMLERYFHFSVIRGVVVGGVSMDRTVAELIRQILFGEMPDEELKVRRCKNNKPAGGVRQSGVVEQTIGGTL